jgi:hypothetical protein
MIQPQQNSGISRSTNYLGRRLDRIVSDAQIDRQKAEVKTSAEMIIMVNLESNESVN